MSCHIIYYKDGAKMMRPVLTREEYMKLRDGGRQKETLAAVRAGEKERKTKLVQMNYSCIPGEDGLLKGCKTASMSVGMDIDHIAQEEMEPLKERILGKKDELGLLMLEKSAQGLGYHLVFRRRTDLSQEENLKWASDLLGVQFDDGAKDITRVFFTTTADADNLLFLDDELFAQKQKELGVRNEELGVKKKSVNPEIPKSENPNVVVDPKLLRIFQELVKACAPKGFIDEEGNVSEGARDNTLLHVLNLFRYVAGVKPDVLRAYLPEWAKALDDDNPGTTERMIEKVCEREMSPTLPPTLRIVLKRIEEKDAEEAMTKEERNDMYCKELAQIEESQRFFFEVPKELPPVIHEFVRAFPFAWKPGAILSLLPVLGTLMSRVRALYLDKRFHSLSFQTVIEADYACGKGNISDMVRFCMVPLTTADAIGNEKLNKYNELANRINQTEKLPEKPDVCVRKIVGEFTVAGFNDTMTTAKGLHIWCSTSEIDEVRRIWGEVSYILRKAYDNDLYGRNLRSKDQYRGERPVYFNTLLCGTPKRVNMVYNDPEDGLVSRTMFFRLLQDDGKIPVVNMSEKTKSQLSAFIQKLHDKFSLGPDGKPVEEQRYVLDYLNRAMAKWLDEKYQDSVRTGNMAEDAFRRRDAVNGFRAGVLAHVLYAEKYGEKMKEVHKKAAVAFALWVAEYSLRSHMAKFGTELQREDISSYGTTVRNDVLKLLPDSFTIADAYEKMAGSPRSSVRSTLQRMVFAGYLKREDRGFYVKTRKG